MPVKEEGGGPQSSRQISRMRRRRGLKVRVFQIEETTLQCQVRQANSTRLGVETMGLCEAHKA
jgi:hypothetical protein